MKGFRQAALLGAVTVGLMGGTPSATLAAGLDVKQVRIAAKVFNFLRNKPVPGARVVVLHGAADVALLAGALGGLVVSEGRVTDVSGALAVFVNSPEEASAAIGINPGILTIGGEVACVDASACIVVVETTPKVAVYLGRKAASRAGIDFDTSFKMLVTER